MWIPACAGMTGFIMQVFDTLGLLEGIEKGWALSIGNFDGVHLGHQRIIAGAKEAAVKFNAPGLAVMTFDPHPVAILHPEKAPGVLTPLRMKKHLLAEAGVDCLIVLKDSYDLLNLSPADFVDKFLMKFVEPAVVIEGPNFNFGYGRSGDVEKLKELGQTRGFEVLVADAVDINISEAGASACDHRGVCSSSLIRRLLEKGFVSDAGAALGRAYRLIGQTVPGRGVGKEIGFPTANISPLNQIVPNEGVYAGTVEIADTSEKACSSVQRLAAVFSIGRAKTFITDHPILIEAHILEADVEDLTGKWLAMDFIDRIRSQQRFENREQLAQQIAVDCDTAKDILKKGKT